MGDLLTLYIIELAFTLVVSQPPSPVPRPTSRLTLSISHHHRAILVVVVVALRRPNCL
jgi:hypothetical protein